MRASYLVSLFCAVSLLGSTSDAQDIERRIHTYMSPSTVQDVATDGAHIWVATDKGLFRITESDGSYVRYTVRDGLCTNFVTALAYDLEGTLWAGMRVGNDKQGNSGLQGGVARFEGNAWTTVYTSANGLPSSEVVSLAFDESNHIWIGTEDGLSYFDGSDWHLYDTSNAFEFYNNPLVIHFDQASHTWIGMWDGAYRYDGKDWRKYTAGSHERFSTIRTILQTADGALWFGSSTSGGVFRLFDDEWTRYTTDDGLISNRVVGLHALGEDAITIVTHAGISTFDGSQFRNKPKHEATGIFLTSYVDHQSMVYVGTLYSYEHGTTEYPLVVQFREDQAEHFVVHNHLSSNAINDIVISTDGSIWFGTGTRPPVWDGLPGRITRYNGNRWEHHRRGVDGSALGLGRLPDGLMWIGADRWMSRFEGELWRVFAFSPEGVFRFTDCSRGACYFTNDRLHRLDNNEWNEIHSITASLGPVSSLATDGKGGLWAGGYRGIVYIDSLENVVSYDETDGLELPDSPHLPFVRDILVDDDGLVWIATQNGIYRFDGDTWQKIAADVNREKLVFTSIARAADGTLWVGTIGEGVYRVSRDEWENLRIPEGLPSNSVTRITASPDGNVWIGTTDGLMLVGDPALVTGPDIDVDTVVLPRSEELPPQAASLYTFPNPVGSDATIVFELPHAGYVTIELFDLQGRLVSTVTDGFRYAGEYNLHFNAAHLPPGIYLLRLRGGHWTSSRSMMIVR